MESTFPKLVSKESFIFPILYISFLGSMIHFKWAPRGTIILSSLAIFYLGGLFFDTKARIYKRMSYDDVWKGGFATAVIAGASLPLPFFLFGVSPEGPHRYSVVETLFLLFGCAIMFGGLAGLVSIVLINIFYDILD